MHLVYAEHTVLFRDKTPESWKPSMWYTKVDGALSKKACAQPKCCSAVGGDVLYRGRERTDNGVRYADSPNVLGEQGTSDVATSQLAINLTCIGGYLKVDRASKHVLEFRASRRQSGRTTTGPQKACPHSPGLQQLCVGASTASSEKGLSATPSSSTPCSGMCWHFVARFPVRCPAGA